MTCYAVADGHVDLLYELEQRGYKGDFAALREGAVTPASLAAANLRLLVCALYCEDSHNGAGSSVRRLRQLMARAEHQLGGLARLRSGAEAGAEGLAAAPALLYLLENGDALLDADLDALRQWGLGVVGLTHAGSNRLADGNGVDNPAGLTRAGRMLVKDLERRGWVIDVAHLAEPAFDELLAVYSGPLISSHTGLRAFCARRRNLSETQIATIVGRGGIIGLSVAPEMLNGTRQARRAEVVRQLDWLVQRFGCEAVALGSDYGGFDGVCVGLEDHGGWPLLAEELHTLGYPPESIAAILGENWLRFYRQAGWG